MTGDGKQDLNILLNHASFLCSVSRLSALSQHFQNIMMVMNNYDTINLENWIKFAPLCVCPCGSDNCCLQLSYTMHRRSILNEADLVAVTELVCAWGAAWPCRKGFTQARGRAAQYAHRFKVMLFDLSSVRHFLLAACANCLHRLSHCELLRVGAG